MSDFAHRVATTVAASGKYLHVEWEWCSVPHASKLTRRGAHTNLLLLSSFDTASSGSKQTLAQSRHTSRQVAMTTWCLRRRTTSRSAVARASTVFGSTDTWIRASRAVARPLITMCCVTAEKSRLHLRPTIPHQRRRLSVSFSRYGPVASISMFTDKTHAHIHTQSARLAFPTFVVHLDFRAILMAILLCRAGALISDRSQEPLDGLGDQRIYNTVMLQRWCRNARRNISALPSPHSLTRSDLRASGCVQPLSRRSCGPSRCAGHTSIDGKVASAMEGEAGHARQ